MPTGARQEVERLSGVHGEARQKVAAATAVCAFFKPVAFHEPRVFLWQSLSARSLPLRFA